MEFKNIMLDSYDDYYKKHLPEIKKILKEKEVHTAYIMALNEAVCNAFRYNRAGEYCGTAELHIAISDHDIMTRIYAETKPFNAAFQYKKIQALAEDREIRELDWGQYTKEQPGGRGFWYMLYGCDVLQLDITSYEISLFISYPSSGASRTKKIKHLAKKFFLKKNGVVQ